jgi:hypothetical protein
LGAACEFVIKAKVEVLQSLWHEQQSPVAALSLARTDRFDDVKSSWFYVWGYYRVLVNAAVRGGATG